MSEFRLQIVTPNGIFFDDQAESLKVRTTEGDMQILAKHIDFVSVLPIGKGAIKVQGVTKELCIADGMVRVERDKVTLIAHAVEYCSDIDRMRAQQAKERAEAALKQATDKKELDYLEYKLKKALNRLSTGA